MHHLSKQGIELIKEFEGFSPKAYLCPAGKWTIGYGHVIRKGEEYPSEGIPEHVADSLLRQDVALAEQAINRMVSVMLKQSQFDALVSLVYNIGVQTFEHSTLLRRLNSGKTDAAAQQFLRWVYAAGRKLEGLCSRRAAEQALFLQD